MNENEKTNIEKLHDVDLEIVKAVVKICDKNGLVYYMSGGTLLGAVRHHGFIPWDDDIDLAMPRDDYEKFLQIAPTELPHNLQIVNYRTDPLYQYYITRVRDTETRVEEIRIENDYRYTNASIDIFPLDGTPNSLPIRKLYFLRVMTHRALMSLCYKDSIDRSRKRGKIEKIFLYVMERLPIERIFDPYKEKCKIDKIMRKHSVEKSNNIGCLMGTYRTNQIVPKRYFGNGKMYKFESIMLRGPELYDEYLTQMYGNYMQLPPKESQKIHFKIVEIKGEKVD
ncbi:MAG: LicD family protein [Clostridiales bacterium]|nr:LicD family protein [Clostridiales bacterium]